MSVAIIGSGASGLTSIKEALEYGLKPTCFEMQEDLGGLWNISLDKSTLFNSTVINTSKEMTSFSDFPMPKDFPPYCPQFKMCEYYRMYAQQFDLEKYITYRAKVNSVTKTNDHEKTGQWNLNINLMAEDTTIDRIFDFVLVCIGHHSDPLIPKFEGQELYKGKIIHSKDYSRPEPFEDKTIIVVGVGNSGCDMAVDLSRTAEKVYLATRTGAWILPRLFFNSLPRDMSISRFSKHRLFKWFFVMLFRIAVKLRVDHYSYGLAPKHSVDEEHPTINDELAGRISVGKIEVRPDISNFTENGVKFKDGSAVDADVVALCTGYSIGFNCLSQDIVNVNNNVVDLYKYVFPPHLKGTLAVIGCLSPIGAMNPLAELQARWAMGVFKGNIALPSKEEMWDDINNKRKDMSLNFVSSRRHTIEVDYAGYSYEISKIIQANPPLLKYLFSAPSFWFRLVFGPLTPSQFRLTGPHPWSGAKNAILNAWSNTISPLNRRLPHIKKENNSTFKFLLFFIPFVIIVTLAIYLYT